MPQYSGHEREINLAVAKLGSQQNNRLRAAVISAIAPGAPFEHHGQIGSIREQARGADWAITCTVCRCPLGTAESKPNQAVAHEIPSTRAEIASIVDCGILLPGPTWHGPPDASCDVPHAWTARCDGHRHVRYRGTGEPCRWTTCVPQPVAYAHRAALPCHVVAPLGDLNRWDTGTWAAMSPEHVIHQPIAAAMNHLSASIREIRPTQQEINAINRVVTLWWLRNPWADDMTLSSTTQSHIEQWAIDLT